MMKKYIPLLIFLTFTVFAFGQMPKWCIPPKLYEFNGSNITTTSINTTASPYFASNAAFDKNNNLLFYLENDGTIYNAANISIGMHGNGGGSIGMEIPIVKVPGTCDKYYIISTQLWSGFSNDLIYTQIDCSGPSAVISSGMHNVVVGPTNTSNLSFSTIAVTKLRPNKTRFLFSVSNNDVRKFTITNSGINFDNVVVTLPSIAYCGYGEADLEEANNNIKLAVAGCENAAGIQEITEIKMNNQGSYIATNTYYDPNIGSDDYFGVEYAGSQGILCASSIGVALISPLGAFTPFTGGTNIHSQIEKANNGKYYTANLLGDLLEIDIPSNNCTYATTVSTIGGNAFYPFITLPDQVDGEDYLAAEYQADLWVSDGLLDTGLEPNLQTQNPWGGDIWNCIGNLCAKGQDDPARFGDVNFMRTQIWNKGCTTSSPADLRMYWTRARTQEIWDVHYLNSSLNMIGNCNAGGEITDATDIGNIPPIQPGNAFIVTKEWTNSVPDPQCFINDGYLIGDYGTNNPMICYLARIESPNDPMVDSWSLRHVYYEIIRNNNIATRNSTLIDLSVPKPAPDLHTILFNNSSISEMNVNSILWNNITGLTDFTELGEITIVLELALYERWLSNGYEGSGIEDLGEGRIRITDGYDAEISNLNLQPGESFNIGIAFQRTEGIEIPEGGMDFQYHLNHLFDDGTLGSGFNFNVVIQEERTDGRERTEGNDFEKTNNASMELVIHPNPNTGFLKVRFNRMDNQKIESLTISDMLGHEMDQTDKVPSGNVYPFEMELDLSNYAAGTYKITAITSDGQVVSKLIIKQ